MTFSVVVTFHNQRDFVEDALDSLLAQGCDDLEIIVVDDASSDGTVDALRRYDGAIKTVLLDQNVGLSRARNAGAAEACGDYLLFLDGDDAFLPWAADVYRTIAREKRPPIIVGSLSWFHGELPAPEERPREIRFVEYGDYFAKDRALFPQAGVTAIATQLYRECGGSDPEVLMYEDVDLVWRLGLEGPVVYVTEPATALHRSHAGQSTQRRLRMLECAERLVELERAGRYPGRGIRSLDRKATVGGAVFYWATTLRREFPRQSLRLFLKGLPLVLAAVGIRLRARVQGRRPLQAIPLATPHAAPRVGG